MVALPDAGAHQLGVEEHSGAHMEQKDKVMLTRMRRKAMRQGLRLEGSQLKDPDATEYRKYRLIDDHDGSVVLGGNDGDRWRYTATLEEVETFLTKTKK